MGRGAADAVGQGGLAELPHRVLVLFVSWGVSCVAAVALTARLKYFFTESWPGSDVASFEFHWWSLAANHRHFLDDQLGMPTKDDLLKIVPIGEENAVSSRLLWQQLGMWSLASIKKTLSEMAEAGLIERRQDCQEERAANLYFRLPDPAARL